MALSMMQELAIRDDYGRCRCPCCGKYRKRSDFPDQPGHIELKGKTVTGHVHVAPVCKYCMED